MAATTWAHRLFEPANSVFWDKVSAPRPELNRGYQPWDSLTDPTALGHSLRGVRVSDARIVLLDGSFPLVRRRTSVDRAGSSFRATHDALTADEQAVVHDRVVARLTAAEVAGETNVIYATATRARVSVITSAATGGRASVFVCGECGCLVGVG